jgi:2-polyprenyl-3-methyl-5-hydroxy-6-metoxy-1,4-benzoquinol methylase
MKDAFKESTLKCILCGCYELKKVFSSLDMSIYRCRKCSIMFQNPAKSQSLQTFDSTDYWRLPNLESSMKIAGYLLQRIIANLLPSANVLEIGSGVGALGSLLLKKGFLYQGIEPSPSLYKLAINNFPELEGKVKNCFLQEASLGRNLFDVIVMVDTLEHIPYPIEFLQNLKQYAKPEALLYLEVPNESLFYFKGSIRRILRIYDNFPTHPTHMNLFTVNTIQKLIKKAGFTPKKVFGVSILGDFERMMFILGGKSVFISRLVSGFFGITKLDLLLGQGSIAVVCGIDGLNK